MECVSGAVSTCPALQQRHLGSHAPRTGVTADDTLAALACTVGCEAAPVVERRAGSTPTSGPRRWRRGRLRPYGSCASTASTSQNCFSYAW